MMNRVRQLAFSGGVLVLVLAVLWPGMPSAAGARQATPAATASCGDAAPAASPATSMGGMAGMDMGTPMVGIAIEFDLLYIDMMIPHHAAIMATAQAALERLVDPRLMEIAGAIVAAQGPEIKELRGYRQQWYGSADPMPMDAPMMTMLGELMPGMGSTPNDMMTQMDPGAQVAAFCAGEDPELTFIDLTIPHHESAIEISTLALTRAIHPELKEVAQRVIDAQQREVAQLRLIRSDLIGAASPPAG